LTDEAPLEDPELLLGVPVEVPLLAELELEPELEPVDEWALDEAPLEVTGGALTVVVVPTALELVTEVTSLEVVVEVLATDEVVVGAAPEVLEEDCPIQDVEAPA